MVTIFFQSFRTALKDGKNIFQALKYAKDSTRYYLYMMEFFDMLKNKK